MLVIGWLGRTGGVTAFPIVVPYKISLDAKARPVSLATPAGCPIGFTTPLLWSISTSHPLLMDDGDPLVPICPPLPPNKMGSALTTGVKRKTEPNAAAI